MNKVPREGFVGDETQPEPKPAALPEPSEPPETWPIRVRLLHRAIRDNKGEEVRELSFREPSGADINRYGNPVRINQEGDVVIDERKMTLIMAALTGILSPLLERMDPRDWNSCAYRLRGFFLPDPAAW
jgi:Phage tail assembly chaperone proteins, E, or 41 or 14